jgi:hypothetical protein
MCQDQRTRIKNNRHPLWAEPTIGDDQNQERRVCPQTRNEQHVVVDWNVGYFAKARQRRLRFGRVKIFVVQCQGRKMWGQPLDFRIGASWGTVCQGRYTCSRRPGSNLKSAGIVWSMRVSHELFLHVTQGEYGERSAGLYCRITGRFVRNLASVQLISKIAVRTGRKEINAGCLQTNPPTDGCVARQRSSARTMHDQREGIRLPSKFDLQLAV